jgi:hypothetical protein
MGGVFKSVSGLIKTASGSNNKANEYAKATRTSPADVVRLDTDINPQHIKTETLYRFHGVDAKIRRPVLTPKRQEPLLEL